MGLKDSLKRIANWYFSKSMLPFWCIIIIDIAIIFASGFFVFWAFHRGMYLQMHFYLLSRTLILYSLIFLISFKIFHTYTGIIRFSSFSDLQRIASATLCSYLTIVFISILTKGKFPETFEEISIVEITLITLLATFLMWTVRIIIKTIYDTYFKSEGAVKTFIYGTHKGGIGLAKNIRNEKPARFLLEGFIAEDNILSKYSLFGKKIYLNDESLPDILSNLGIKAVLISPQKIEQFRDDQQLQNHLIDAGIKIYIIHKAEKFNSEDKTDSGTLKEVNIADLLPRSPIEIDLHIVEEAIKGHRILITGSAGSIGKEIVRQAAKFAPSEMMLIDQAETPQHDIRMMMEEDFPNIKTETVVASISNKGRMRKIFTDFRPDYVFHAAAYKHVPMMEDNPSESIQNNILGTKILADLAIETSVRKFVMVSTDKAVNPTNVMGCSKRICEIYVQSLDKAEKDGIIKGTTQFVTTRFGNVLGSNGSVIPIFEEQIRKGGPVTVTDPNIIRYFMLIPEACKLVLEAGIKGNGGEIFVFDMGKPVKIADLAKKMIKLSGAKNIEIKYTGLRQGEKLYEEVLSDAEKTKPSFNDKIRIASVREYDFASISKEIDDLISIADSYEPMEIVAKMKQIVPEYKCRNSVYEVLDRES